MKIWGIVLVIVLVIAGLVWYRSGARCRDARSAENRYMATYRNPATSPTDKTIAGSVALNIVRQNGSCFSAEVRGSAGQ